jgi:hypothetical protein
LSKGPKTLETTNTTAIDPTLKARQDAIYNQAQGIAQQPYQPFTGERFEGFNPDQQNSFDAARQAAGAGGELFGAGAGAIQNVLGGLGAFSGPEVQAQMQRLQIDPSKLPSVGVGGARDIAAQTGFAGQSYQNPYEQQVVDQSLGDIERARAEAAARTRAQAAQAGAFGGSRSGVAESLTNRDFGNAAASTAANLRSRGFETALGAGQADQNRTLQADQANQGKDVAISGQGVQAGAANQSAALQALLGNQQFGLQAGDLGLRAAGLGLQGGQALAGLGSQQQQMGAFGADLLSRIGAQQQGLGQAGKDFDYQQFAEGRAYPQQQIDWLQQLLGQQQYGSTQRGVAPNTNRGSILGTIGGVVGAVGGPIASAAGKYVGDKITGQ